MTQGFRSAGFQPVLAVEHDPEAAATYAANFGEDHVHLGDIAALPDAAIPRADVVIGGPPCQGFSGLGAQNPNDPRNKLWREYMRVLEKAKPKVFVIENVDRFQVSNELRDLVRAAHAGGALDGYSIEVPRILNAADYGVPQRRKRTIVIGSWSGFFKWPEPTHGGGGLTEPPHRTLRDAIGDVPWDPFGTELPDSVVEFFGREFPGIFKQDDLHIGRNPTPLSLRRYDCIAPGGGRFDLPDELSMPCWRNKPSGTSDVMGRLRWDAPSVTVRTEFFKPEKGRYLHPQWDVDGPRVNRPLTHLEAAKIQSFPDDYLWCGRKISIARQIGNAVPPLLAQRIAEAVRTHLETVEA